MKLHFDLVNAWIDAAQDGDLVLGAVVCDRCGYGALAICSPGWDGPNPELPSRCPECGSETHALPGHTDSVSAGPLG